MSAMAEFLVSEGGNHEAVNGCRCQKDDVSLYSEQELSYRTQYVGDAENAGLENAGLENSGPKCRGGKRRTGKRGTTERGWKTQDWKT